MRGSRIFLRGLGGRGGAAQTRVGPSKFYHFKTHTLKNQGRVPL